MLTVHCTPPTTYALDRVGLRGPPLARRSCGDFALLRAVADHLDADRLGIQW